MNILIHMGNYKTGSTSIQSFLYENRETLQKQGIYYGDCDDSPLCSHASFTYSLLRDVLKQMGVFEAFSSHPVFSILTASTKDLFSQMLTHAKDAKCDTLILSHEALFCEAFRTLQGLRKSIGEAFDEEDVLFQFHKTLYKIVSDGTHTVSCIIYLRRQDDYLESQYNQYIKAPWYEPNLSLPDFDEFISLSPVTLDYRMPLDILEAQYGWENLYVCHYQEHIPPYLSFAQTFLGLSKEQIHHMKPPVIENRSISLDIITFKQQYIKGDAAFSPQVQEVLTSYSYAHPQKETYTLFSPSLHQSICSQLDIANEQINEDYSEEEELLPPLTFPKNKKGYPGLTPECLLDISQYVTEQCNEE